ncbi:MAG: hypothetical protein WKF75_13145, partial [Singulisphaera sp.]
WDAPATSRAVVALGAKAAYLNETWFLIRAGGYFVLWTALALALNGWSSAQDRTRDNGPTRRLRALSAPGLILYVLSITFSSVDWLMSLEPNWWSTIYGLMVMAGQGLATFALM